MELENLNRHIFSKSGKTYIKLTSDNIIVVIELLKFLSIGIRLIKYKINLI